MPVQFTNNASSPLVAGISDSDISFTVIDASAFPTLAAGDHCYVTIVEGHNLEIVKVTDITGNVCTCERGQDNTSAISFNAGAVAEIRLTSALLSDAFDENTANATDAATAASAANTALSEEWATKTDGQVDATDYSSKAYAVGGTGVTDGDGAAKEWATKTTGTVDGSEYSAKHYAEEALGAYLDTAELTAHLPDPYVTGSDITDQTEQTIDADKEFLFAAGGSAWSLANGEYSGKHKLLSGLVYAQGIFMSVDGRSLYVAGYQDKVTRYPLATAFNIASVNATPDQSYDFSGESISNLDLAFSHDGLHMYLCANATNTIRQYDLTSAWDLTTAAYSKSLDVSAHSTSPRTIDWSDAGNVLLTSNNSGLYSAYNCSTPYDLATATYASQLNAGGTSESGRFGDSGNYVYVLDVSSNTIRSYALSTPYDLSTAILYNSLSLSAQTTTARGLCMHPEGTSAYIVDLEKTVYQYELSDGLRKDTVQGIIDLITSPLSDPTGIDGSDQISISVNDSTRVLTVAPTGSSYDYYINGQKHTISSSLTITLDNITQLSFVYLDEDETLKSTTTFSLSLMTEKVLVAIAYYNAAQSKFIGVGKEDHGCNYPGKVHAWAHSVIGTTFESGLALNNMVVDGNGSSATHAELGVDSGIIWDEDLRHEITAKSHPANLPVYYRSGSAGDWYVKTADDYPFIYSGTAGYSGMRVPYNEWTGSTWQLTETPNRDFVLVHIMATNDARSGYEVIAIQGQNSYPNRGAAREGATNELLSLSAGDMPFAEFKAIATVIIQTSSSYSNTPKARFYSTDSGDDYIDWRYAGIGNNVGGQSGANVGSIAAYPTAVLAGHINGVELANNSTDANNDIDVSEGVACSDDGEVMLQLTSAMTKRLDASWSAGTGNGGLDTGSKAADTWCHVFLIGTSDGTVDVLFSTSATSPTMPSGYVYKRRLGSVLTDSSGNILAFTQQGDWFWYKTSITDVNLTSSIPTTLTATTFSVPTGVSVVPLLFASVEDATAAQFVQFSFSSSSTTQYMVYAGVGIRNTSSPAPRCPTNTSGQIYIAGPTSSADRWRVYTSGWVDNRGK